MMDQVGIPAGVQEATMANHEPNKEGVYPDWADPAYVFKFREMKIVDLFETHRNAAIHWFQNGHPMKTWITDCEELLGVNEKQAKNIQQRMVQHQTARNGGSLGAETKHFQRGRSPHESVTGTNGRGIES